MLLLGSRRAVGRSFLKWFGCGVCISFVAGCDAGKESQVVRRFGSVNVTSVSDGNTSAHPYGFFYRSADQADALGCTLKAESSGCRAWTCDAAVYTAGNRVKTVSAGDLTISSPDQSMELTREDDGYYRNAEAPAVFWNEGDSVTVSVSGSDSFPELEASVVGAAPLVVTLPEFSEEGLTIEKGSDLEVEWTGGGEGKVYIAISPRTEGDNDKPITTPGIDCSFSAKPQRARLPASFIAQLPAPDNLVTYQVDIVTLSDTSATSGDAWLDFRTTWLGMSTTAVVERE